MEGEWVRVRTTILIPALVATAAVAAFGLTGFAQAADQGSQRVDQVSRALTEPGLQGAGAAPKVATGRLAVGGVDVELPTGANPVTQGPTSIVESALPDTPGCALENQAPSTMCLQKGETNA